MSMMEEFLELQEKVSKYEKLLSEKEAELNEKDDKLLELSEKINQLTNDAVKGSSEARHFRSMMSVLETDKKNLERERDRLLKENETLNTQLQQLANAIETSNQTIQAKEELLLSKEKQLQHKDQLLMEKDDKLEAYRKKFDELSEEKEKYQKEKFDAMEKYANEKVEYTEKLGNLEKVIQENDVKLKSLKKKSRAAQDGLLGASMEIDSLNEKVASLTTKLTEANEELEKLREAESDAPSGEDSAGGDLFEKYKQDIKELEAKLEEYQKGEATSEGGNVFAKGTGSYKSLSALITHFKFKIGDTRRTIRIILPSITDIEEFQLSEQLYSLPPNILKNLACFADTTKDMHLIGELKNKNFKITDYRGPKLFALSIDNLEAALAVYDEENKAITGIYTNNEELVRLISQAIMNPFIKGVKI